MFPALTSSPPNFFTPRLCPCESRPLRLLPKAFLCAIVFLQARGYLSAAFLAVVFLGAAFLAAAFTGAAFLAATFTGAAFLAGVLSFPAMIFWLQEPWHLFYQFLPVCVPGGDHIFCDKFFDAYV